MEQPFNEQELLVFFSREILQILAVQRTDEQLRRYILENIIPEMNERRKRSESLSEGELEERLYRPQISGKPGEYYELARAMVDNQLSQKSLLTPDEALEMADIVYYELQKPSGKIDQATDFFLWLFIGDIKFAYEFCIVKYLTRLRYGDHKDYKQIEERIMQEWFEFRDLPEAIILKIDES